MKRIYMSMGLGKIATVGRQKTVATVPMLLQYFKHCCNGFQSNESTVIRHFHTPSERPDRKSIFYWSIKSDVWPSEVCDFDVFRLMFGIGWYTKPLMV